MTHEFIHQIEHPGEVILNNVVLPVQGSIGFELVNSYGRQMAQGDPGPNDHPLNSVITQATWTGGIGTKKYKGDDSRGNSWWTTMWDGTENMLSLPVKTFTFPASTFAAGQESANVYTHDKLGNYLYFTYGPVIRRWNETTDQPESFGSGNSPATPSGRGVAYGDSLLSKRLYIPCGSSYVTHNGGASFTAGIGSEEAISFVVWQQKLFKIDAGGIVKVLDTSTPAWVEKGRLTTEVVPWRLFLHYDNDGQTAVHVATSGGVYILDYVNAILWETPLVYPDHPESGRAATLWRGDAYVSAGLGVHRDAKGLVTAVGPDGREGVPEEYAFGYFTDFAAGYNGLLGLYRAYDPDFSPLSETSDMGVSPPEAMYSQEISSFAVLFEYDILGWHPRWVGEDIPTSISIASHAGVSRAFWGGVGNLYSRILPRGYFNPSYNQNEAPFEYYAQHITPYFNFGVDDNAKIIKQIEMKTGGLSNVHGDNIRIYVQVDDQTEWGNGTTPNLPFAIMYTNGEHHFDIGFAYVADKLHHLSLAVERIRLLFEIRGVPGDNSVSPWIEWYSIVGRKWMRANRVFTFSADLTQPHNNVSTRKMFDAIFEASTRKGGSTLVIGNETFEVDITSDTGNIAADLQFSAYVNVSAAETTEIDA